jgi:hypothetical protein
VKANRKSLLALFAVPAAVILFVPWSTTVVPTVRVQVFDESGKPAAGIRVEQEWMYQAIGSDSQRAVSATSADGYIAFPKRSVRMSFARKALSFVRSLAPVMCADGFGPSGSISAYGPDPRAWDIVVCDANNPTPRPLKLTRWDLVVH